MAKVAESLSNNGLPFQLANFPQMAHWFFLDSISYANSANRDGLHANSLAITRQCVETISVIELGLCRHPDREDILEKWWRGEITPGGTRKWLSENIWPGYGSGLWQESWGEYMGHLAKAVQPYAHYTGQLAQWQMALRSRRTKQFNRHHRNWPSGIRCAKSYQNNAISRYFGLYTCADSNRECPITGPRLCISC